MIETAITAILIIMAVLLGWVGVQHLAKVFARRHPEFGEPKDEVHSCLFCFCRNKDNCQRRNQKHSL